MRRTVRWVTLLLLSAAIAPATASAIVEQPFVPRFNVNEPGAIWVTGDMLMTCPAIAPTCAAVAGGHRRPAPR